MIDWQQVFMPDVSFIDKMLHPETICLIKHGRIQPRGLRHEMITRAS
jgi:uncharacterized membrane protein YcaP (DUF421 family)